MIAMILYFVTFFCVAKFRKKHHLKFKPFPNLLLKKDGIVFISNTKHRIRIGEQKYVQLGNKIYLKTSNKLVVIFNVDKVFQNAEYLYFTALGKVRIIFDCHRVYKYFNIEIDSKKFSLNEQKQSAILDLINNNFEINFCKTLKNYIKNIKNILNIHIFKKKLIVKQNKFHLPFVLKYKINNRIRKVYINETLEENQQIWYN